MESRMFTLTVILTIVLCLLSLALHEIGHALAAHKCKVPVQRIGLLGFPLPYVPYLKFPFILPGAVRPTSVEIHPLLLGAFVTPDESALRQLGPLDKAFIFGAGPHANFLYACVLYATATSVSGSPWTSEKSVAVAGVVALAIVLTIWWRFVARFIVPLLGLGLLLLIGAEFFHDPGKTAAGMGGPVGVGAVGVDLFEKWYGQVGVLTAFHVGAIISIILGLTNTLPIPPLDGGQIFHAYLVRLVPRIANSYLTLGVLLVLILFGTALVNDGLMVWQWMKSHLF